MKTYLGDAVYADIEEQGMLKLTAEDGIRATDTIYLEQAVWEALLVFMAQYGFYRAVDPLRRAREERNAEKR